MAVVEPLKFLGIYCSSKAGSGLFKVTADQLGWKCTETGASRDGQVQFASKELVSAEWHNAWSRKWLLKLCLKEGSEVLKFVGFEGKDLEPLKAHLMNNFKVDLKEVEVSTKGYSWGDLELRDFDMHIKMDNRLGFEVPISKLAHVAAQSKADLNLELKQSYEAIEDEVCTEIRFQVIPERISAETLQQELQQKAGLSERGEVLASISDVMLVAPRGKHNLEFLPTVLKVHGKSQTHSVKYSSIARLFLVTLPEQREMAIVVGLEHPLSVGAQKIYFLVFTISKDLKMVPNLPEDKMKAYNMAEGAEQEVYLIMGRLLKDLSGKVIVAPASELKTSNGVNCIRCNHKAQPGWLYPLKKSVIFITKPVIWIRYEEIDSVEFVKGVARARSFDIAIHIKDRAPVEFLQMDAAQGEELARFLKSCNVRLINEALFTKAAGRQVPSSSAAGKPVATASAAGVAENSEDDEDFEDDLSGASSSAGEIDDESDDDSEEKPKKKRAKTK